MVCSNGNRSVYIACSANLGTKQNNYIPPLERIIFFLLYNWGNSVFKNYDLGYYIFGHKGNNINMIIYDTHFNLNEWLIIIGFFVGYLTLFILPKRFPLKVTFVFVICGIYSGFFYDHSLSVEPVDFYDVNDRSQYQFIDFISYLMYGPWSYLFFYLWDCIQFKFRFATIYIFVWGVISLGLEKVAVLCGVYHYKNGYELSTSFPIYLLTFSIWSVLYYYFKIKQANEKI